MQKQIADFDGKKSSDVALRIETKLAHLKGRADRMCVTSDAEKDDRSVILSKLLRLIYDFDEKLHPNNSDSDDSDKQTGTNPAGANPATNLASSPGAMPPALSHLQTAV